MQKTKIGVSVGLLGAAIYFTALFGGYTAVILLVGYALLFEDNAWLKKSAVKAVAVMVFFSFLTAILNLIPNAVGIVDDIFSIFHGSFGIHPLTSLVTAAVSILSAVEKLLLLALGASALRQGTVGVPVVDNLIEKHM